MISTSPKLQVLAALALTLFGCAPSPSPVQVWQEGKAPRDRTHNYFADITEVNPSITYVKIASEGFTVNKPFPVVYFSDQWIEVNTFLFESDIVMSSADLSSVLRSSEKLSCDSGLSDKENKQQRIEVITHLSHGQVKKCYISPLSACPYLKDIASANYMHYTSYNLYSVVELARQIKCADTPSHPTTLDPWPEKG